jgi:tetratricopeptide (TPR) repeat protein
LSLVVACFSVAARGQDTVIVQGGDDKPAIRRTGTIVEYNGDGIVLQLASGRQEQIGLDQVVATETQKNKDHVAADRFFAEGKYRDALTAYRAAVEAEDRAWMRREVLARMVVCYQRVNRFAEAGQAFSMIVRSDPKTIHFSVIPLCWTPRQPPYDLQQQAKSWLEEDQPAMALLGASWLLNSADRAAAEDRLRILATGNDANVAMLAEAQRWRTRIVTATLDDTVAWQRRIEQFPEMLRAGPYLTVGRALARLKQHQQAALIAMRIPILHAVQYDLAAEGLMLAGEQLQLAGNQEESRSVLNELVRDYSEHELAAAVKQQWEGQQ